MFRHDGQHWTHYTAKDGVVTRFVWGMAATADGSIWASAGDGISRFDGRTWTAFSDWNMDHGLTPLVASPDGALWINRVDFGADEFKPFTMRYRAGTDPPETRIAGYFAIDRPLMTRYREVG